MAKVNTEEILAGLKNKGIGVTIENIQNIIRENGFIVKVHVGRLRNSFEITPEIFGINLKEKSKETKEFFTKHMNNGKLIFIPESEEKALKSIEMSLRNYVYNISVGFNNSFIPLYKYDELMEKYEEVKERYYAKRDEILAHWDEMIDTFKKDLKITLNEFGAMNAEEIYNRIVKKIPSKEEYKNSFYFELRLTTFPVLQELEFITSDDIKKKIKQGQIEDIMETVHEITGNLLNTIFDAVNKLILALQKEPERIPSRTIAKLKEIPDIIEKENIFFNPKIEQIKTLIQDLIKENDFEVMTEKAENTLAFIYGYSTELGLQKFIDTKECLYENNELLEIYKFIK